MTKLHVTFTVTKSVEGAVNGNVVLYDEFTVAPKV